MSTEPIFSRPHLHITRSGSPSPSLTPDDVYVLTMSHKMNVLSSDFLDQLDAAYDFMD